MRRRRKTPSPSSPQSPVPAPVTANPDQAWQVLGLVTEWVKHAEAKAAATLTVAGVIGGVLYNLVDNLRVTGPVVDVAAVVCVVFAFAGGLAAAWSLKPRLWSKEPPSSPIYYHHIARRHARDAGPDPYAARLRDMTVDQQRLTDEISAQIWANAHVATTKYRWANLGLAAVLVAVVALAVTTAAVGWRAG
jgi:hypothetical protein